MTHYVLLQFKPGTDMAYAEQRVEETYQALQDTLPYLHDPVVHLNCIERDSNADIMVTLQLDSEENLQPYLTHPLHLQMAKDLKDSIAAKISFDHS